MDRRIAPGTELDQAHAPKHFRVQINLAPRMVIEHHSVFDGKRRKPYGKRF